MSSPDDATTREAIEAAGFDAICVHGPGEGPDCASHHHVPGERRQRGLLQEVNLPDIPIERVVAAVKELLDLDSLRNVVEVQIGFGVICAVVYATDEQGHQFLDRATNTAATHVISRRVAR